MPFGRDADTLYYDYKLKVENVKQMQLAALATSCICGAALKGLELLRSAH